MHVTQKGHIATLILENKYKGGFEKKIYFQNLNINPNVSTSLLYRLDQS